MEVKVNLVLLGLLGIVWASLSSADPVAALDPLSPATQHLSALEDEFAADPSHIGHARELSRLYIELGQPGLAITTIRSADPHLLEDPILTDRLATAYELSGRVSDAVATADLALARCGRALGDRDLAATPVPRYGCAESTYAQIDVHLHALSYMARWGVGEPSVDHRAVVAYELAQRSARVAIVVD
ncbi:MAG: hypothetical protein IPK60_14965 [Sandaracinaceae bacterium]|nr:hypothetical protein [Sandaracinaceae bacterium]